MLSSTYRKRNLIRPRVTGCARTGVEGDISVSEKGFHTRNEPVDLGNENVVAEEFNEEEKLSRRGSQYSAIGNPLTLWVNSVESIDRGWDLRNSSP